MVEKRLSKASIKSSAGNSFNHLFIWRQIIDSTKANTKKPAKHIILMMMFDKQLAL